MRTEASKMTLGLRHRSWIALLVAASLVLTLGFACAVPLAAFAAVAALTLRRRDALIAVGLVWLANQAVGFTVLQYPWTTETLAWGVALLAVGFAATLAAELYVARYSLPQSLAVAPVAFLVAFAAYEGLLFAVSAAVQSGTEAYSIGTMARIFAINALAFVGLVAISKLSASWPSLSRANHRALPAREA